MTPAHWTESQLEERFVRYSNSEIGRLSMLYLKGFVNGEMVLYCGKCLWQIHGDGVGIANDCPHCSSHGLSFVKVDQELKNLCES